MRLGRGVVTGRLTLDDGSVVTIPDDERPFDRIVFERKFDRTWPPLDEDETEENVGARLFGEETARAMRKGR